MLWYHVKFDDEKIYIIITHRDRDPTKVELWWENIIRICYVPMSYIGPDEIYIFTNQQEESFLIPSEALGATELWGEIVDRELYDAEKAIKVMSGKETQLYCWPPAENEPEL